MRKEGRRRSKAGLKVDFSGGEAKKSRATGCWTETSFCCRWRCPICRDVTATEGESRTIGRICQTERQQEDFGTGDFNCSSPWSGIWSFSTSGLRSGQRGWRNLQRWLGGRATCLPGRFPSKRFGSKDIFTNNPDNVITSIPPGETSMKCWRRWQVILGTLQRRQQTKARWVVIEQLMI